ncbi:S1C family serine protease [Rhodococcus sp. NPDC003318]|uniref:S1C family serine protease n=1 Tax=Rhodococcus sp. NPDC003318 TaxID=3364503 RepID=UPI0036BD0907
MDSSTRARRGSSCRLLRAMLLLVAVVALLLAGNRLAHEPVPSDVPVTVAAPQTSPPVPLDPATLEATLIPSIVTLTASAGPLTTAGTGIVLSADGLVLTNHHVIDGATDVDAVTLATGADYDTEVLGYDRFRDVAVLRLIGADSLPVAPLGRSADLALRDPVTAIGNADGRGVAVSARGVVTALNESVVARNSSDGSRNRLTGMIEVDADIRPGDSGGPLVNAYGLVVGVSTAGNTGMRPDPSEQAAGEPVPIESYAVPIDDAVAIADQIRGGRGSETVHIGPTPLLGVAVTDLGQDQAGARVVAVGAGSPAEQAGVVHGDVIVSWNDTPIRSQSDLTVEMARRQPGDRVEIGWIDAAGTRRTASLVLATGTP